MSASIVLPNLTQWTEQRLRAIYNATTRDQFNEAFDGFVAEDAHVTVNGKHMSREQYKQLFWGEKEFGRPQDPASLNFGGTVEVPTDSKHPTRAGSVGLYYSGQIYGRYVVHDVPVTRTISSTINVNIVQANKPPHLPPGVHGDFDGRRANDVNEVVTDKADPIINPGGPIQPE